MVHAKLGIAEENSGKLVTLVKNELRKIAETSKIELLIIDGPPGVGCPVISSLSGANLAILITEATISGLHDLERVIELVEHFEVPAKLIINKYDLSEDITEGIIKFAQDKNIELIGKLPYDTTFVNALVQGLTITEYKKSDLSIAIKKIWEKIIGNEQN